LDLQDWDVIAYEIGRYLRNVLHYKKAEYRRAYHVKKSRFDVFIADPVRLWNFTFVCLVHPEDDVLAVPSLDGVAPGATEDDVIARSCRDYVVATLLRVDSCNLHLIIVPALPMPAPVHMLTPVTVLLAVIVLTLCAPVTALLVL
jgi:hypothetical protein